MPPKIQTKPLEDSHCGEYFKLTAQYLEEYGPNTVVLYQTGSFLEIYTYYDPAADMYYGSRAVDIARMLDLKLANTNRVYVDPRTRKEKHVYMSGFNVDYSAEKYIRQLQELHFTVVIFLEDPQTESDRARKAPKTRSLHSIVSPGTYLATATDDAATPGALTNNIACVWIDRKIPKSAATFRLPTQTTTPQVFIGIAMVDVFTGATSVFQYSELNANTKDMKAYDELDNFLHINRPNEVIFIHNVDITPIIQYLELDNALAPLIRRVDIDAEGATTAVRARNCAKQIYQAEVVRKFYTADAAPATFAIIDPHELAAQAFVYLLEDIFRHNPNLVKKLAPPQFENHSGTLILANHSLKQLNMIDDGVTSNDATAPRFSCVANFLNMCVTPMGRRHFNYSLFHPSYPTTDCKRAALQAEYDITETLLQDVFNGEHAVDTWKMALAGIKDLAKYERQILNHKTPPATFYHIHQNIAQTRTLLDIIEKNPQLAHYFVTYKDIAAPTVMQAMDCITAAITAHIDLDAAATITHTHAEYTTPFIAHTASTAIKVATENYNTAIAQLAALKTYLNSLGAPDAVTVCETDKEGVITLVATARRWALIESALPRTPTIIEGTTITASKGMFSYVSISSKETGAKQRLQSADVDTLCSRARIYKKDLIDSSTDAYARFISYFESTLLADLATVSAFISTADVIFAKASLAYSYGYCKPKLGGGASYIQAECLRHPLIEQILTSSLYVPNNLAVGAAADTAAAITLEERAATRPQRMLSMATHNGDSHTTRPQGMLLYGTNMVGKTSFIKSAGIAIIMAQAGIYVPATSFEYSPYQYIFTRILGTDNLFKGQSTFATEMLELRTILQLANSSSLVIGDELCSGTETASAVGIFMSGVRHLYQAGASFLFATHLHELANFPEYLALMPRMRMCHMRVHYDRVTDALVYDRQICEGSGDTMYGLEVCAFLKMPDVFLQQAYQYRADFIASAEPDILSLTPSRYNTKKLKGTKCEACGAAVSTEIHHTIEQHTANPAGLVTTPHGARIHKNHPANLVALCESCHLRTHGRGPGANT
jgi:DNA mismatch repair protein MutS